MPDNTPAQRHVPRQNEIAIRLHYSWGETWCRLEAQQWNTRGFCFFHAHALPLMVMPFKRSLHHFKGEIVWSRACHDPVQVMEMLLNEALHARALQAATPPETQERLLRLMRVQGLTEAKHKVLAALGDGQTTVLWQQRVEQRMQSGLFQSGVRVSSPVWEAVVAEAQALGDVVQDLERWSGSLGTR
jgi:hypothetical protein